MPLFKRKKKVRFINALSPEDREEMIMKIANDLYMLAAAKVGGMADHRQAFLLAMVEVQTAALAVTLYAIISETRLSSPDVLKATFDSLRAELGKQTLSGSEDPILESIEEEEESKPSPRK